MNWERLKQQYKEARQWTRKPGGCYDAMRRKKKGK